VRGGFISLLLHSSLLTLVINLSEIHWRKLFQLRLLLLLNHLLEIFKVIVIFINNLFWLLIINQLI